MKDNTLLLAGAIALGAYVLSQRQEAPVKAAGVSPPPINVSMPPISMPAISMPALKVVLPSMPQAVGQLVAQATQTVKAATGGGVTVRQKAKVYHPGEAVIDKKTMGIKVLSSGGGGPAGKVAEVVNAAGKKAKEVVNAQSLNIPYTGLDETTLDIPYTGLGGATLPKVAATGVKTLTGGLGLIPNIVPSFGGIPRSETIGQAVGDTVMRGGNSLMRFNLGLLKGLLPDSWFGAIGGEEAIHWWEARK